jgi:hypothetical protein
VYCSFFLLVHDSVYEHMNPWFIATYSASCSIVAAEEARAL